MKTYLIELQVGGGEVRLFNPRGAGFALVDPLEGDRAPLLIKDVDLGLLDRQRLALLRVTEIARGLATKGDIELLEKLQDMFDQWSDEREAGKEARDDG